MKTFKDLLSDIAEKETDAQYNLRMRKTAKTLKRNAKKGQRRKKINVLKRRTDDKLDTAAREKAKRIVLKGLPAKAKASMKRKKVIAKDAKIDMVAVKIKKALKK